MILLSIFILACCSLPAFAANPFMDVPEDHWAYEAVETLAAHGIAVGFPDGAYGGMRQTTRYELAAMVAKAVADIDARAGDRNKITQDIELLKKLVTEFRDELSALGVSARAPDGRLSLVEDGIGGWQIRGIFRFDATFANSDSSDAMFTQSGKETEFNKERFRLYLTKLLDENTFFYAEYRAGGSTVWGLDDIDDAAWTNLFVDTKLPWDVGFRAGRFDVDFEGDYGLYIDDDALYGDITTDGFQFRKNWNTVTATAIAGRNNDFEYRWEEQSASLGTAEANVYMSYMLDLHWTPDERFMAGATCYWNLEDSSSVVGADINVNTYGVYAGYSFTEAIAAKGIYYFQNLGDTIATTSDTSPNAWKAIADIGQDALKFTSLWVEYSQVDNSFISNAWPRYCIDGANKASALHNQPTGNSNTTCIWFVKAVQQWTEKLNTSIRFTSARFDTPGLDNAVEWGVGVGYQYTPALYFELIYDQVDFGHHSASYLASPLGNTYEGKESVVRLRTAVSF